MAWTLVMLMGQRATTNYSTVGFPAWLALSRLLIACILVEKRLYNSLPHILSTVARKMTGHLPEFIVEYTVTYIPQVGSEQLNDVSC